MKKYAKFLIILALAAVAFAAEMDLTKISRIDMNPVEAVNSDGQVVYAGVGGALNIYNIYHEDFPQLVGTIEGHSSRVKAIIVQDYKLFVLWEKEGLELFDITDRYQPMLIGKFPGCEDERFKSFTSMDIEGDVAYIAGADFLITVDISEPRNPLLMYKYVGLNGAPLKLDYYDGRVYLAAGYLGLGALFTPNPHQFYFLGADKGVYTTVKAYQDIVLYGRLDERGPEEQSSLFSGEVFSFPFESPAVVKIAGDVVYAGGMSNFATYKLVEGSPDPVLVWELPNMPTLDCVLRDDVAYLANSYKGLSAFYVSDISHPTEIGRLETYDVPRRACIVDNELFVAAGLSGVVKFDVSNPSYPILDGRFASDKLRTVWDVKEHEGFIYVLGTREEPTNNIFIEKYTKAGNWVAELPVTNVSGINQIGEMAFGDGYCAISLGRGGIAIIGIRIDKQTENYSLYDPDAQFSDIEINDGLLYASDYWGGYHIFRIGEGMPTLEGYVKTSEEGGNGIALVDNYLLAADGPNGLAIIDVSTPTRPRLVSNYPTNWGTDLSIEGDYAFLSDGKGACKVFDISKLPYATLVAELPDNGYCSHIYTDGDYIYGIDQFFGVYIYEFRQRVTQVHEKSTQPEALAISSAYPNPFNSEIGITITLSERTEATLSIYDITGRTVTTLISDVLPAGTYTLRWRADDAPTGTYFAALITDKGKATKKLLLVK